ncbi:bifunctional riboflavin kinase/FAD synthetase [Niabella insulamsoli]|uniref:bifunctional riboflavin kinase/FAD synthetase n=1 Tax=Niabella insulamsoli TaxID=3144874 RepID=UPI0031FD721C
MRIHYDINKLPAFKNAVITIGTFDGVHEGHKKIISQLTQTATAAGGESVIITFHPHPRKVVSSSILGIRLINTLSEKTALLEALGVDHLVITPFTEVFANQEPEAYLKDFLIKKFHPHTIIIGYDHRFGKNRRGDYKLLENFQGTYGYQLKEIPKHILDHIGISSTKVREAILSGDTATASQLLGYHFFFEGEVVHGDKLGRELGYPTANLQVQNEEKILPGDGIYAVYASVKLENGSYGPLLKGMMSVGFRPTVDGSKRVIEVNLFDFQNDIYGRTLRVYVKRFLRPEEKFDSLEALIKKIDNDKVESLKVL